MNALQPALPQHVDSSCVTMLLVLPIAGVWLRPTQRPPIDYHHNLIFLRFELYKSRQWWHDHCERLLFIASIAARSTCRRICIKIYTGRNALPTYEGFLGEQWP